MKPKHPASTILLGLLLPALILYGCGNPATSGGQALVGVTVIDGLGHAPAKDRVVVIRDGRIAEVRAVEGWEAPRGMQAIRLPGRYVMPGLIDAHARVTTLPVEVDGSPAPRMDRADSDRVLRTLLGFGITTVRDPVATEDAVASDAGERVGPRIVTAVGSGTDGLIHGAPWSLRAAGPDGFGASPRERLTELENIDPGGPEIQERIAALAERGAPVIPTLVAIHARFYGDDPRHRENPELHLAPAAVREAWARSTPVDDWMPEDFARAKEAWPRILELTRKLHEGGVLVTAGSDLPEPWVIPGVSLHRELQLLHDAGIPPLEVLRIATHHGAVALGLGDEIGSIEPGKVADLVVLAADPTVLLSNTRAISHVFLGGRFFDPAALLAGDP